MGLLNKPRMGMDGSDIDGKYVIFFPCKIPILLGNLLGRRAR